MRHYGVFKMEIFLLMAMPSNDLDRVFSSSSLMEASKSHTTQYACLFFFFFFFLKLKL
jgi:hypothetical protein